MINSWKQFWSSEERIVLSLCLLGIVFGLTIGIFSKDWAESFDSIEVIGYHIPPPLSFGIAIGLAVQLASVLSSWITLYGGTELYFGRIIQLLIGIPMGVLIILNIFEWLLSCTRICYSLCTRSNTVAPRYDICRLVYHASSLG